MELVLDADPEDLQVWLQEAEEQLQVLDESIIRLEKESEDEELLQSIFRAAHTLKGSSGTIRHTRMAELTHATEGVLDELRNRRLGVSASLVDALLESLDNLRLLRDEVLSLTIDESIPVETLVKQLNDLMQQAEDVGSEPAPPEIESDDQPASTHAPSKPRVELTPEILERIERAEVKGTRVVRVVANLSPDSTLPAARKLQLLNEAGQVGEVLVSNPTMDEVMEESEQLWLEAVVLTDESDSEIKNALAVILDVESLEILPLELHSESVEKNDAAEPESFAAADNEDESQPAAVARQPQKPAPRTARQATTVRVDVERLDNLMNLVGEMVIDKTRLEQLGRDRQTINLGTTAALPLPNLRPGYAHL